MRRKFADLLRGIFEKPWWGYPLLLLLVGFVSYEYAVAQLGYYWDDWEVIYLTHLASLSDMVSYFSGGRPFVWPYALYATLVGANPAGWHIITFLLRYGGIVALYFALMALWPARKFELRWMGLLLMVFPGFMQQSISAAYSSHFSSFFLFSLSLYLTVLAVRAPSHRWLFWIGSFLVAVIQIFTIEYYVGLELIRPIFIWMLLEEDRSWKKLRRVLVSWSPFFLALVGFLWWRLVIDEQVPLNSLSKAGARVGVPSLLKSPVGTSLAFLHKAFFDVYNVVVQSWLTRGLNPVYFDLAAKITWFAFAVAIIAAILALCTIRRDGGIKDKFLWQAPIMGGAAMIFGSLPLWGSGITIWSTSLWADRYLQAPMIGATLFVVGLISLLVRVRWQPLVMSVLLFMGITTQMFVVNKYHLDWDNQKNIYWQLYWRAPAISPDTAIYSYHIPSVSLPDYDASYAFALLYARQKTGIGIPYWLFTIEQVKARGITPDTATHASFRAVQFSGGASDGISIVYPGSQNCLRIVDPIYALDPQLAQVPGLFPLSNPTRIQNTAGQPPAPQIFGPEPPANWCTFFEQGDLARQFRDWKTAARLYEQAEASGFAPASGGEYLPFIEAYDNLGNFSRALDLSLKAAGTTENLSPLLCQNWLRIHQTIDIPANVLEQVRSSFACTW